MISKSQTSAILLFFGKEDSWLKIRKTTSAKY